MSASPTLLTPRENPQLIGHEASLNAVLDPYRAGKLPHAWITAFAPYEKPEIVVTVLAEESGEGSTVAQPVAADIIRWWAENR